MSLCVHCKDQAEKDEKCSKQSRIGKKSNYEISRESKIHPRFLSLARILENSSFSINIIGEGIGGNAAAFFTFYHNPLSNSYFA